MESVALRHEDAPGGAAAAPAEAFSSDGASRDSTGDERVSMPDDSPVGSLDELVEPIFSGPRQPIGGVRVKLSRCSTLVGDAFFNEKTPLLSGIRNKIKHPRSGTSSDDDGGVLSYVV